MEWTDQNWKLVMAAFESGKRVVPVVGADLLMITDENGAGVSFPRLLARRLYEKLSPADASNLPGPDATLHQIAATPAFLNRREQFASALREVHEKELPKAEKLIFPEDVDPTLGQPPVEKRHPLRLLAEVEALSLFLTTTPDGLFHRVLARVRGQTHQEIRGFTLLPKKPERSLETDLRATYSWDLPPAWDPANRTLWPRPLLYHVFGRLDDPEDPAAFDITEEDHLEMLCRLHSESYQPEQLYRELKPAHILFIGLPLAQWHARFFLRILRAQRLAIREERCVESLVADGLTRLTSDSAAPIPEPELVAFLERFSSRTGVYRSGDPSAFVHELHRLWTLQKASFKPTMPADVTATSSFGSDLNRDGVFISYPSEDAVAARKLAQSLRAKGIKVFLDSAKTGDSGSQGLEHGSDYERKLRQNIAQCTFFIPLLSRNIRNEGRFYRREWKWATSELEYWTGVSDRNFIRPLIIDNVEMPTLRPLVPDEFLSAHVLPAPAGEPNESFFMQLLDGLARWQGVRPSSSL